MKIIRYLIEILLISIFLAIPLIKYAFSFYFTYIQIESSIDIFIFGSVRAFLTGMAQNDYRETLLINFIFPFIIALLCVKAGFFIVSRMKIREPFGRIPKWFLIIGIGLFGGFLNLFVFGESANFFADTVLISYLAGAFCCLLELTKSKKQKGARLDI
jgi:drug/metabolite transporter (DMT)-like permease